MNINLDKGEIICPKCNGKGGYHKRTYEFPHTLYTAVCRKCYGNRNIDWIENLINEDKLKDNFVRIMYLIRNKNNIDISIHGSIMEPHSEKEVSLSTILEKRIKDLADKNLITIEELLIVSEEL